MLGTGGAVIDAAWLTFSAGEACAAAGITYRQLDYWVRAGAIEPSTPATGTGSRAGWSVADIERLTRVGAVVRTARAAGFEPTVAAIGTIWAELVAGRRWRLVLTT